ncbi:MAG TPA: PqqD family protein [Saprospiraceae bacterium]|nr:PqqD family protein [Saprospiraceae bacterium]
MTFYQVAGPNLVHETIDGESILLNLETGVYYSLNPIGSAIWEILISTGRLSDVVNEIHKYVPISKADIHTTVEVFVKKMVDENILKTTSDPSTHSEIDLEPAKQILLQLNQKLQEPELYQYSDMKDLFLLDPIHDVDESGWPQSKPKEEGLKE